MKILEAILDLNKTFMLEGYRSDFSIRMSGDDFYKFLMEFEKNHNYLISYPDLQKDDTFGKIKKLKIAGPGSYFFIECERPGKDFWQSGEGFVPNEKQPEEPYAPFDYLKHLKYAPNPVLEALKNNKKSEEP